MYRSATVQRLLRRMISVFPKSVSTVVCDVGLWQPMGPIIKLGGLDFTPSLGAKIVILPGSECRWHQR